MKARRLIGGLRMKKRKHFLIGTVILLTVLLNVIAWQSKGFCDFYVKYIFPVWINIFGRITSTFSFSVGELMIVAGIVIVVFGLILGFAAGIYFLASKKVNGKQKMKVLCRKFYTFFGWSMAVIFAVMTLNCYMLYHTSSFSEKYLTETKDEYSLEELALLRNYVVMQANELARQVERDEEGKVIYSKDMSREAISIMQNLGESYDQLKGYYPVPKELKSSEFLCQQYMQGYYFPFSMEANYNGVMYNVNKPVTMCHELAHVKGFIYEDDANLIGFLACINSNDPTFQYSGYLSVLNYIDNDFYEAIGKNKQIYSSHEKISSTVKKDNVFLTEEAWVKVEQKAVVKTAVVSKIADNFLETNLVLNGINEGMLSYSNVVSLLLDYYDGNYGITLEEEYLVQQ